MILDNIKTIYNAKGLKVAQSDAYSWFKKEKNNPKSNDVYFIENQMLQVGKINQFSYNPKWKDTLDYYDKRPVVLSLGVIKKKNMVYEIGINLNFIPEPYKWMLLDRIQNIYRGFFEEQKRKQRPVSVQPQLRMNYQAVRALLKPYGFEYAIRLYIPSRKSKVYAINYNSWVNVAFLSIEKFEKITYNEMYAEFMKFRNKN